MRRRATILAATGASLAVVIAGCGGSDEADGPAALVPADAPAYVELVVQPEGEAAEGAEAALAKITGNEDPGGEIVEQIEAAAKEDGAEFNFDEDIEPWLGERMGVYPATLSSDTEAVLVVETTDADRALESVESEEDQPAEEKSHEGTSYRLADDGDAYGIVDGFLVFSDEQGFKQSVDAADGDSLADSSEFTDSVDGLPSNRLATLFAVPSTFLEAIPDDEIDPQGRGLLLQALGDAGDEPITGDLVATPDDVTLELSAGGGVEVGTEESALVSELPASAWLGLGLADIGGAVENALSAIEGAGIPGVDAAAIRRQLRAQSGVNLEQDVINALGDAAFFLEGTTAKQVGGALVVETKDPGASARLLTKLQGLISRQARGRVKVAPLASTGGDQGFQLTGAGLAQPIRVVQRGDRIVAGYGAKSVLQGLSPQTGEGSLEGTVAFSGAQEAIGGLGIDAFLDFAPVLELVESEGAASDPGYQRAKPYLEALSFLALGSGSEDDRAIVRFIVGLGD